MKQVTMVKMKTQNEQKTLQTYGNHSVIQGYYEKHGKDPGMLLEIKKFSACLKNKGRVLDLGCGPGHDSINLCRNGLDVIGLDFSEGMLELARNIHKCSAGNLHFQQGNIKDIRAIFPENYFDGVWAVASIHHLYIKEGIKVLKDIKHILKPRGYIYLSVRQGNNRTKLIKQEKYGVKTERLFSFWNMEKLNKIIEPHYEIISYSNESIAHTKKGSKRRTPLTTPWSDWINLLLRSKKDA